MALHFVPEPGTVLLCDYDLGRSSVDAQEMTKVRPVVVLSPRRRAESGPYLIVPFSTQAPSSPSGVHYRIPAGTYAFLTRHADSWAKGEFVSSVGELRLDRLRRNRSYLSPRLRDADLRAIRMCVIRALGALPLP